MKWLRFSVSSSRTTSTSAEQANLLPSKSTTTDNRVEEKIPAREEIEISKDYRSANEQNLVEEESERLASNALNEAIREIIQRPASSVDTDNQEPAIDSLVGIMRQVKTTGPRSRSLLSEVQNPSDLLSTVPAVDADSVSSSQVLSSEVPTTTTDSRLQKDEDKSTVEHVPQAISSEVRSVSTESTRQSAPETVDQINVTSIPDVSASPTESAPIADTVKSDETKHPSTDAPVDFDQRMKIVTTTTTTTEETTHSVDSGDKGTPETTTFISDSQPSTTHVTSDQDQALATPLDSSTLAIHSRGAAEEKGGFDQSLVDSTAVTKEPRQGIETSTEQVIARQSSQEEVSTIHRDEEAQADRLTSEVFKQVLEEISTTPSTDHSASLETSTPHSEVTTSQSSTSSITPADNSTSLTETVRQILATPVSIHLPSVDHSQTTTTQASSQPLTINDGSSPDPQDKSSVTHQSEAQSQEVQHISERTAAIERDTTESNPLQRRDSTDKSESPSADSSPAITHQVSEDHAEKIEATVETITNKQPDVQSDTDLLVKEPPVFIKVTSPEDDEVSLQSSTVENDQSDTTAASVLPDSEDESLSSSVYEKIDNVVSEAIVDARVLLDQSATETGETQSLSSTSSVDASSDRPSTDTSSVSDTSHTVDDGHFSTAGLVNIVHEIRNLPNLISSAASRPREDNKIIISSKSDIHEQIKIGELTNIVDSINKTLNSQGPTTEQSASTNEGPPRRASAVAPTLLVDAPPDESPEGHGAKFFVPGTPTPSENDFRDIYERRYFVSSSDDDNDERLSSSFVLSKSDDAVLREEGDLVPDSPMAYYELQEERHTLMSPQQSVGEENQQNSTSPSLTTWTTIQPLNDFEQSEEKQPSIDLNLDDQAYEYARQIDLESSAVISNLPTREYRQVFGVSDEIVHAVDDMTYEVDRTLSAEQKSDEETNLSEDLKRPTSNSDDTSLVEKVSLPLVVKEDTSVSSSVQRITDALNSLESDLLKQEELATESEPLSTEQQQQQQQSKDDTVTENVSNRELDARYSALLEHIDSLQKPLATSQSSASSAAGDDLLIQTTAPADETSAEDTFSIDGLLETMQQILSTPFRTVSGPYEKLAGDESGLTTTLEQILASTQYRTIDTKLAGPVDTRETADQREQVEVSESHVDDAQSTSEDSTSIKDTISDSISSVKESVQHFFETIQPSTVQKDADEQISAVSGKLTSGDAYTQPVEPTLARVRAYITDRQSVIDIQQRSFSYRNSSSNCQSYWY